MIGARTLAVLGVAALAMVLGFYRGVLDVEYLGELEAAPCLLVGLFASLATVLAVSTLHVDGRSVFGVGLHRGRVVAADADRLGRVARDVPVSVQRVLYFVAFACIGLTSFGPESAARLANARDVLGAGSSEYCPDPGDAGQQKPAPAVLPDQRGCALVRRAFELGYRKNLGNCAPAEPTAKTEAAKGAAVAPCELRQRDEPALHYAWRLFERALASARSGLDGDPFTRAGEELRTKLDYLPALTATTREAILASPRASHHLWTNLPAPRRIGFVARVFGKNRCAARFGTDPPRLDWSDAAQPASELLEAALGQLLFSPRHGPAVGNCEELSIHWGAATDTCARLIDDALGVLSDVGATGDVRAVLARHHSRDRRAELADALGRGKVSLRSPDVRRVVSFQCLMTGAELTAKTLESVTRVDGIELLVRERRVSRVASRGAAQLDVYRDLAALLAGGSYLGPVTERGVENRRDARLPPDVLGGPLPLARLEFLYDADPFLGDGWPLERGDLTEVYPFEVHLRHFTEVFRRGYLNVRGRL